MEQDISKKKIIIHITSINLLEEQEMLTRFKAGLKTIRTVLQHRARGLSQNKSSDT
ncbi:hypothetical protein QTP88_023654 [Uroleucon formosanum]